MLCPHTQAFCCILITLQYTNPVTWLSTSLDAETSQFFFLYYVVNKWRKLIAGSLTSDVGNNHLSGTLKDLIGNGDGFPSLRNLYVDWISYSHHNMYSVINMPLSLICRYLNDNQMTGGLPDQLANMTNLEILCVFYHECTLTISLNDVDIYFGINVPGTCQTTKWLGQWLRSLSKFRDWLICEFPT